MAKGRGRLSSIELLPQECSDIVSWAAGELQANGRSQLDIYGEFVSKLKERQHESRGELDFRIPSFSSFNRYSVEQDAATREIREAQEMASTVLARIDHNDGDDLTKLIGQMLKAAVYAAVRSQRGKLNTKNLQELANTARLVAMAEATSAAVRRKAEEETNARIKAAVGEVATVVQKAGVSKETMDEINRRLGII